MDWDDISKPNPTREVIVGQSLERLSLEELRERIVLLRDEIERVEKEIELKQAVGARAAAVFKT
ncbi:MAG: DUF1192 domain-containing protein [Hyphomicrobiaceae bacterium]